MRDGSTYIRMFQNLRENNGNDDGSKRIGKSSLDRVTFNPNPKILFEGTYRLEPKNERGKKPLIYTCIQKYFI